MVFIPRLLTIYQLFNDNAYDLSMDFIKNNKASELFYIPLFYRDLYLQFYMQRCLSLADNVLLGTTTYEKIDDKIHVILAENDNKVILDDVLHYLTSKKYNCKIKIFENKIHGDFAFDKTMQQYVINIINNPSNILYVYNDRISNLYYNLY